MKVEGENLVEYFFLGIIGENSKGGVKIDSAFRIGYRRENRPRDVMVKFADWSSKLVMSNFREHGAIAIEGFEEQAYSEL